MNDGGGRVLGKRRKGGGRKRKRKKGAEEGMQGGRMVKGEKLRKKGGRKIE